jgi:hypothetical protein
MITYHNCPNGKSVFECPSGNVGCGCTLDDPDDCIVGQPVDPDMMMKLLDL